ncbi:putative pumilio homolog 8, chloroplastic [Impatiens glandulifera]|uniref:putative pumilio homolog 8, chloroplastic n=1 Tax=Impatiens glandulifera TaxID=253017 RepID=UPI001FB147F3|nr:putative pumilio homolog 8, chloroplastic [Impatiens glandulifera]
MFQDNMSRKGKNVMGDETTVIGNGNGNVTPLVNINHQTNHRQFQNGSFDGSGYFPGGFCHADEIPYSTRMNHHTFMMNSNGYDPDTFDISESLSRMSIGNGFSNDYSIPRTNPSVFNSYNSSGFGGFKGSDLELDDSEFWGLLSGSNHSENPYSNNHYNGDNPYLQMMGTDGFETAFNREGSIVVDENSVQNNESFKTYSQWLELRENGSSFLSPFRSKIHLIAKDQQGCRFLQSVLGEGTFEDLRILFKGMISHIVELMMDPFGNYLVQKLLEICDDQQRWEVVIMVTKVPGDLVRISLNTHGTRAVQKLIETLTNREQIALVVMALKPCFIDLVKDLNGNHVIQHCLEKFSRKDNEFIFAAATRFCFDIATHQHGCCVMNRCILHSVGSDREKLVAKVASNGLILAQDAFGNYVVQLVIELNIPSSSATLMSQFEGNYVFLSTQKFSSHVVEKCLKFMEQSRERIVRELLLVPRFDQLLKDPYANYVVKSALINTKLKEPVLYDWLEKAVSDHEFLLRTNPFCKEILSLSRSRR